VVAVLRDFATEKLKFYGPWVRALKELGLVGVAARVGALWHTDPDRSVPEAELDAALQQALEAELELERAGERRWITTSALKAQAQTLPPQAFQVEKEAREQAERGSVQQHAAALLPWARRVLEHAGYIWTPEQDEPPPQQHQAGIHKRERLASFTLGIPSLASRMQEEAKAQRNAAQP